MGFSDNHTMFQVVYSYSHFCEERTFLVINFHSAIQRKHMDCSHILHKNQRTHQITRSYNSMCPHTQPACTVLRMSYNKQSLGHCGEEATTLVVKHSSCLSMISFGKVFKHDRRLPGPSPSSHHS